MLSEINLRDLQVGVGQTLGAIRLIPLLRDAPVPGLRLATQALGAWGASLKDDKDGAAKQAYLGYLPHGMVVRFGDEDQPEAMYGGQLLAKQEKLRGVPLVRRMHRRLDKDTLRLLPLDLAMEGFLGLCFSGPDVAWRAYSEQAIRVGLGCRSERVYSADEVDLLDEAVRTFEIQHGQVGVLLFVSEGLAAAFVTPNADDYRRLHASLLNDFFGDVVVHYARLPPFQLEVPGSERPVADLDQLALRVGEVRHAWQVYGRAQADGLLDVPLFQERVRKMHGFELRRFRTALLRGEENHIGEAIVDPAGRLAYLKTFRLSTAQCRRARLLLALQAQSWNLEATARAEGISMAELVARFERSGFGYLLKDEVRRAARRR
ncbi:MAG: hypothetical protein KC933_02625 [Myxococcales bacterium]|nr:hypothetical protein [Myxococcales bacterium]